MCYEITVCFYCGTHNCDASSTKNVPQPTRSYSLNNEVSNWARIWQSRAPDNSCWGETRYTCFSDLHRITWARALTAQHSQGTSSVMSAEAFPVCHIRGALTQLCAVRNQVDSLDLEHLNPLSHLKQMNTEHAATWHDSSSAPVFMSRRALAR